MARRGYDQLYVVLEGPEQDDVEKTAARVVGYAALRGEQDPRVLVSGAAALCLLGQSEDAKRLVAAVMDGPVDVPTEMFSAAMILGRMRFRIQDLIEYLNRRFRFGFEFSPEFLKYCDPMDLKTYPRIETTRKNLPNQQ